MRDVRISVVSMLYSVYCTDTLKLPSGHTRLISAVHSERPSCRKSRALSIIWVNARVVHVQFGVSRSPENSDRPNAWTITDNGDAEAMTPLFRQLSTVREQRALVTMSCSHYKMAVARDSRGKKFAESFHLWNRLQKVKTQPKYCIQLVLSPTLHNVL